MPVPPQTPYPKTAVARHSDSANSIFLRGANVQNDYDAVAIAVRRFRPTANVVIRTFKETTRIFTRTPAKSGDYLSALPFDHPSVKSM